MSLHRRRRPSRSHESCAARLAACMTRLTRSMTGSGATARPPSQGTSRSVPCYRSIPFHATTCSIWDWSSGCCSALEVLSRVLTEPTVRYHAFRWLFIYYPYTIRLKHETTVRAVFSEVILTEPKPLTARGGFRPHPSRDVRACGSKTEDLSRSLQGRAQESTCSRKHEDQPSLSGPDSLLEHDLVEAIDLVRVRVRARVEADLVGGADAERGALVDARDLDVQHRAAGDAVGGLATWLGLGLGLGLAVGLGLGVGVGVSAG
eukprot:scaffold4255_cov54-Phaeocystis_antarctica.AAC.2